MQPSESGVPKSHEVHKFKDAEVHEVPEVHDFEVPELPEVPGVPE